MAEQLNPLRESTGTVYYVYYCLSRGFKSPPGLHFVRQFMFLFIRHTSTSLSQLCLYLKPPCYATLYQCWLTIICVSSLPVHPLLQKVCFKNTQFWKWAFFVMLHRSNNTASQVFFLPAGWPCLCSLLWHVQRSNRFSRKLKASVLAGGCKHRADLPVF